MWTNLLIILIVIKLVESNNLCARFEDYATLKTNPNCWYNQDLDLDTPQVIRKYGFPCEVHHVITADGYILTLFRIPHNGTNPQARRAPLMLQHGHSANSKVFVLQPGFIAFVLSNEGYDVWLTNIRSSVHSQRHVKYTVYDKEFWRYSFHEMGMYDLPAMVGYISSKTGQKVVVMGHSMGTSMTFIYASMNPEHAQKHVQKIIALAPVAYMKNTKGITRIAYPLLVYFLELLQRMSIYGYGNQLIRIQYLTKRICRTYPAVIVCGILGNMFMGSDPNNLMNPTSVLAFLDISPSFCFQSTLHFLQLIGTGEFRAYDHGLTMNLEKYRSPEAPYYNISNINVPVYLFYGKRDPFSTEKDTLKLYNQLTSQKKMISVFELGRESIEYDHGDFLSIEVAVEFYKMIADYIRT